MKHWPISKFLSHNIMKKLEINDYSLAHLALILSIHYLVKSRSRRRAVYNNKCTKHQFIHLLTATFKDLHIENSKNYKR